MLTQRELNRIIDKAEALIHSFNTADKDIEKAEYASKIENMKSLVGDLIPSIKNFDTSFEKKKINRPKEVYRKHSLTPEQLAEKLNSGMTLADIAKEINVSWRTVKRMEDKYIRKVFEVVYEN